MPHDRPARTNREIEQCAPITPNFSPAKQAWGVPGGRKMFFKPEIGEIYEIAD